MAHLQDMPLDYLTTLGKIKGRIRTKRLCVGLAADAAMVLLYWEIGRIIWSARRRKAGERK